MLINKVFHIPFHISCSISLCHFPQFPFAIAHYVDQVPPSTIYIERFIARKLAIYSYIYMLWHQPIRLFIFTISYEVDKVFLLNNNYDITHHQAQNFLSVVRHCYGVYQLSGGTTSSSAQFRFMFVGFFTFCCRVLCLTLN